VHLQVFIFLRFSGQWCTQHQVLILTTGRCIVRLLQSELSKDGALDIEILNQLCTVFEGACKQVKDFRQRSKAPEQQPFTQQDLEWFARSAYNLSLQYCSEISPDILVKLLGVCIEVGFWKATLVSTLMPSSSLSSSRAKKPPKPLEDYHSVVYFANSLLHAPT
jgi:hypothetical protein